MSPEGSTRTGIVSGCPSLDKGSRDSEVGFEPRNFRNDVYIEVTGLERERCIASGSPGGEAALWLQREFTDRKVRGSNPTSASRLPLSRLEQPGSIPAFVLPSGSMAARHRMGVRSLSRLGQPGSIPALVLPSGGMAARHRKGATTEGFFSPPDELPSGILDHLAINAAMPLTVLLY
ncbi:hypothetical protein CSKR_104004 [Clonorchis sinensis]|uniref:Uncharacterized protein n=1 Tax=Clonorchis sinensis TaxID=79923 RepID=A0A419QAM2_CLOSI|nr:hypothetical protein CSKR_104004 [Clonorchis sinensis]